ncbi:MAG: glutamate formimidoyltransferase [Defluviitaleaceae bacterium]|nr:glutamate formimidoyltransferase [Defluviitaleaceae bacterium]MCL2240068.1 glutamate formimidoyltransferase [Defluviitaleaceae bacterium]MCL2240283.1 glutamate formimidoyltransferase [Defluviitaleaceae bacterium]
MVKIIECIPNFSEGRREEIIEGLAGVARGVAGVTLLDYSADASHNRSVFTLMGDPEGIKTAAIALAKFAAEHIDLTRHEGEHPRMGATDVIPFVPIKGATMADCIAIAREVGETLAREVKIPVFLYEEAATKETRRNLATVRKGQFEGMAKKLAKAEWKPDFGDCAPHPTAGVTAVGARMPLIAFNVNLSTSDVKIADNIAKVVRGSGGGLKYCKGIGILLEERNIAQVSMNMVNYEGTPLYRAVELIKAEAKRYGVHVIGTELIGLAPVKALVDSAEYYLQLEDFDYGKQVLENHLW